jgi:hypothetical protein
MSTSLATGPTLIFRESSFDNHMFTVLGSRLGILSGCRADLRGGKTQGTGQIWDCIRWPPEMEISPWHLAITGRSYMRWAACADPELPNITILETEDNCLQTEDNSLQTEYNYFETEHNWLRTEVN